MVLKVLVLRVPEVLKVLVLKVLRVPTVLKVLVLKVLVLEELTARPARYVRLF
jgi:hypothetical protein